jgi:hypothetical protein
MLLVLVDTQSTIYVEVLLLIVLVLVYKISSCFDVGILPSSGTFRVSTIDLHTSTQILDCEDQYYDKHKGMSIVKIPFLCKI